MDKRLELKNKLQEANESLLRQEYEQAIKLFCDARQLAPGDSKKFDYLTIKLLI